MYLLSLISISVVYYGKYLSSSSKMKGQGAGDKEGILIYISLSPFPTLALLCEGKFMTSISFMLTNVSKF